MDTNKKVLAVGGLALAGIGAWFLLRKRAAPPPPPPPPGLANLYGTVTDITTGQPLAGVQVVAGGVGTVTEADGSYLISYPVPMPATVTARFSKQGYLEITLQVTLTEGSNRLDVALQPEEPPPPTVIPWSFSGARAVLGTAFPGGWWQVDFSCTITNIGDAPATKQVTLYESTFFPIEQGGFWSSWAGTKTFSVTLAPGQSYNYSTTLAHMFAGDSFYVRAYLRDQDGYESDIAVAP